MTWGNVACLMDSLIFDPLIIPESHQSCEIRSNNDGRAAGTESRVKSLFPTLSHAARRSSAAAAHPGAGAPTRQRDIVQRS